MTQREAEYHIQSRGNWPPPSGSRHPTYTAKHIWPTGTYRMDNPRHPQRVCITITQKQCCPNMRQRQLTIFSLKRPTSGTSPGDLVAKTPPFQYREPGFNPSQGTRSHMLQLQIPHATMKIEDPACCNQDPVQPSK